MKSNRTAVKALRSGCGKCSERGLGPCADGIAAAKKKMEARGPDGRRRVIRADCRGDLGRIVAGTCAGLPRGLPSGDAAVSTGVVLRLRGPGGRWSGGAVERAVFLAAVGTCAGLPRGLPSGGGAVLTGRVLRLRGPGG